MINSKITKRILAGVISASLIFQGVSVGADAKGNITEQDIVEQESNVIDFNQLIDNEVNQSDSVEEDFEELNCTDIFLNKEDQLDDEENDQYYDVKVEVIDKYETNSGKVYLKIFGKDYKKIDFSSDNEKMLYSADMMDKSFDLEFCDLIPMYNYDYSILVLKGIDNNKIFNLTIKEDITPEEPSEEKPSENPENNEMSLEMLNFDSLVNDAEGDTEKKYIYITKKQNVEINTEGILYNGYNEVGGKLEIVFKDGKTNHNVKIYSADETEEYGYNIYTKEIYDLKTREVVKLNSGTRYIIKYDNKNEIVEVNRGSYLEKVRCLQKPKQVIVYKPYSIEPVLTYTVADTEKCDSEDYYHFSEKMLASSKLNIKEEVYDVHVIIKGQRVVFENVVFDEIKWDNSYEIEVANSVMWNYETKTLNLYYGNEYYNKATLIIKNAKKEPVFSGFNSSILSMGALQKGNNDNEYVVELTANAVSATKLKITVGSQTEEIQIQVNKKEDIKSILFYDEKKDKVSAEDINVTIDGLEKTGYFTILIDPALAVGYGDVITPECSDNNIVEITKVEDIEYNETDKDKNETGYKLWNKKKIFYKTKEIGVATISLKVKNSNTLRYKINVDYSAFTEVQKDNLRRQVGTLYAITNYVGDDLYKVELPEGWEWIDDDPYLAINDSQSIKGYKAKYTQKGYSPFETWINVATTQVMGVSIEGEDRLTTGDVSTYSIKFKLEGYQQDFEKNKSFKEAINKVTYCSWQTFSTDLLKIKSASDEWNVLIEAGKTQSINEGVIKLNVKIGADEYNSDKPVEVLTEHIDYLKIQPIGSDIRPIKYVYDEKNEIIHIDEKFLSNKTNMLKLKATAKIGDTIRPMSKGVLDWKINDESVASIKEDEDGSVYIKILKPGTAVLTVTASDVGKYSISIPIEIRNYMPIMEKREFTLNKYFKDGIELPIHSVEGNPIISVYFDEDIFRVDEYNGKYYMKLAHPDKFVESTKVKANINVRTEMHENLFSDIDITIDTKIPKITYKQISAPNIFYTNARAQYQVVCDFDVESITNVQSRTKGFVVENYDSKKKIITVVAKGLTALNADEFKNSKSDMCNIAISVKCKNYGWYEGYGSYEDYIKITPKIIKPKLSIREIITIPSILENDTFIYEGKTENKVIVGDSVIKSLTDEVEATSTVNGIKIKYYGDKSKNYKLYIDNKQWTLPLTLSGKITVATYLSTTIGVNKITLNKAHNIKDNGVISIPVSVKNNSNDVIKVDVVGTNDKSKIIAPYIDTKYNAENNTVEFGLNNAESLDLLKAGTYSFNISATILIGDVEVIAKPAVLGVTVVDASKSPVVKLAAKGSINLVDRNNTSIVYNPTIMNMTAELESAEIIGAYTEYFTADVFTDEDGKNKIRVKANPKIAMSTAYTYQVEVRSKFNNNTEASTIVKIKPTNKYPKLKPNTLNTIIYKAADNSVNWNVFPSEYGEIERLEVVENKVSKNFSYKYNSNMRVTARLGSDVKRVIKKGNYTITYNVIFKDQATNAKPATLKMTITVK